MKILNNWVLLFLFSTVSLMAQDATPIMVRAKVEDDHIVFRWAPTSADYWQRGNKLGYFLEKLNLADGAFNPRKFDKVNESPYLPWGQAEFLAVSDKQNTFIVGAAAALYPVTEINARHVLDSLVQADAQLQNRFSLALRVADLNAEASRALALGAEIPYSKLEENLAFRITIADSSEILSSDIVFINTRKHVLEYRPEISSITALDGAVKLKWDRHLHAPHFTAYFVERSENNIDWQRLHQPPFLPGSSEESGINAEITFVDSISNYRPFFYRIIGIDLFGEESRPSVAVRAQARDLTPPAQVQLLSVEEIGNGSLSVQWEYPHEVSDFAGFNVTRSRKIDGEFVLLNDQLIDRKITSFIDGDASDHGANLYRIEALDTAGNRSYSNIIDGILRDTLAPAIPSNLRAVVMEHGVVELSWNKNAEQDLFGYLVCFSHDTSGQFMSLHGVPIENNFFRDSLNLNSRLKHKYYSVRAIDNLRHHSEFSPWVEVMRPDTIPPMKPDLFAIEKINEETAALSWRESVDPDLAFYILESDEQDYWQSIDTVAADIASWTISLSDQKQAYRLVAVDQSGLRTYSEHTRRVGKAKAPTMIDLAAAFDSEKDGVKVRWSDLGERRGTLYRAISNTAWTTLKTIGSRDRDYLDQQIGKNQVFKYRLKAVGADRQVAWSDVVVVEVK